MNFKNFYIKLLIFKLLLIFSDYLKIINQNKGKSRLWSQGQQSYVIRLLGFFNKK